MELKANLSLLLWNLRVKIIIRPFDLTSRGNFILTALKEEEKELVICVQLSVKYLQERD